MSQKSYNETPSLYLIPTPIGNRDDITLRTIEILKKVDVVFSEDTRVTKELLKYLKIDKKLISNHLFNEDKNKEVALELLKSGKNIGLVSDRGTPVISDPGYELAHYIISQNYNVIALPGATALIPALIMSGISPQPFTFYGFLNSKESKRKKELEELKTVKWTLIFYEAPHRLMSTLGNILDVLGDRNISISREITKKFEEVYRGKITEVMNEVKDAKGEFVIVVEGNKQELDYNTLSIKEHLNFYMSQGIDVKEAMKLVAKERKISKSIVYSEYHK